MTGNVPKPLLVTATLYSATVCACTSWVVHPSRAEGGRMLLQKCRDSQPTVLDAEIRATAERRRRSPF